MSDKSEAVDFLSDNPIDSDEDDAFRHAEYVDALEQILSSVKAPWHIGIFGKWGSGKTSIIKLLFDRISEHEPNKKTICVEFDAWKHAEDSIRTELLLTLDRELGTHADKDEGLIGEEEITGRLYDVDEEQRAENDDFLSGIYDFVRNSTHLIAIVTILAVAATAASFMGYSGVSTSLLTLILVPLLVFMSEQLQTATTTLKRKFVYPRKEWSGAYERIFQQLIKQTQEDTNTDRIIISIDNLDRCQSQTVYDVLVSLKTFMDVPPCVYIIPCDDEALQSHIQQIDHSQGTYFHKSQNTQEFLRKFFQTTIRIPPILADDIEDYAEKQNARLSQEYDVGVLDVVTKAYIKTPRRIKQGLNRVTALYVLAKEIEESESGLEKGRVTNDLAFLAKIAVLEEDYPDFYDALQDDHRLLDDVDRFFTGDLPPNRENNVEELFENTASKTSGVSSLRSFLKATRPTSVPDIKPFLYLSEPHYSGRLDPNFVQYLRTNQTQEIEQILANVDKESTDSFGPHCDAIENTIDEYDREGRDQALFSTIESILEVYDEFDDTSKERVADSVGNVLAIRINNDFVNRLNPTDLIWLLDRIPNVGIRTNLFETIAETVVSDEGWQRNRFEPLVWHALEYEKGDRAINPLPNRAKQTISDQLLRLSDRKKGEDFPDSEFGRALELIRSYGAPGPVMTDRLFQPLITSISREEGQTKYHNSDLYIGLDEGASLGVRGEFISRLLEHAPTKDENRANRAYGTLASRTLEVRPELDTESADELYDYVKNVVDSQNTKAVNIIESGFHFYPTASEETQGQFKATAGEMIESWESTHAQRLINWAIEYECQEFFEDSNIYLSYTDHIPNKFSSGDQVSEAIRCFASRFGPEANEKMEEMITGRSDTEQQLGAEVFSSIPGCFTESQEVVIETCLKKARKGDVDERKQYLTAVATVFHEINSSEQQTFIDRLEALLNKQDNSSYRAFKEVWDAVDGETEPRFQRQLADSVIEKLEEETQPPDELVRVLYDLHRVLDKKKMNRCVELMTNKIGHANDKQSRSIFNLLADCPEFDGVEDAVLTRVESYLSQSDNKASTHDAIYNVLTAVEEHGSPDKDRLDLIREDLP